MTLDPYTNSEADLDGHPDWEQHLIDVASYREEADTRRLPHDPEWDTWEMEALIALGRLP